MANYNEHTVNISLGVLASKVDRGELDISEAVERAYDLGRKGTDDEPPTVRFPRASSIPPNK
jgi:hypothetical protein